MPTVLQMPVTMCAFAAWAAERTSLVSVPAERVAFPAARSTETPFRERRLISRWCLPFSFWREEDRPWVPDWARKGRELVVANFIWEWRG
jgi:hypothetical protein